MVGILEKTHGKVFSAQKPPATLDLDAEFFYLGGLSIIQYPWLKGSFLLDFSIYQAIK